MIHGESTHSESIHSALETALVIAKTLHESGVPPLPEALDQLWALANFVKQEVEAWGSGAEV
jgi:hypothetical protein